MSRRNYARGLMRQKDVLAQIREMDQENAEVVAEIQAMEEAFMKSREKELEEEARDLHDQAQRHKQLDHANDEALPAS